ncbi:MULTISPECIES: hypothetical protein [Streptomyces]|uniref:DUF3558 domain-containing protein n=1 Tax=Streptomyces rhizosphaericola TaxID=2564098 RepID=A0ABY2PEZ7_9ACTN|nr:MULTISPECIES: hypothetical protein [Streptomyces]ARI53911.1 hypothetical protein A6E92_18280 [Streptomyces sp. S8]MYU02076.1 DUF3558 domain-containing protein [Streptomyces sp. SID8350]NGO86069.1 DUF3558 domain-containing protein [Streptomyces sp. 196(2019)]TGZ09620.1 DUF3558 domain-containing protein [Streptomyces rhizosphaericola]SCK63265.1 hypothetical protein YUWDRAFT_06877 [Streptomyces sp. AmelKG-D3]
MAYVPGVALLAALAVGCSAGSGGGASDADSKPGNPAVTTAPPGKYRTLPAPCRAVPDATLKDLLPGIAQLSRQQQEKALRGAATITYDTDRKVGCSWKSTAPDSSRNLTIDFERVVSYDPAVSDEDRARALYVKKENAAELPGTGGGTPEKGKGATASAGGGEKGTPKPGDDQDATDPSASSSSSSSSAPPSPSASASGAPGPSGSGDEDLRPRVLDGLGDAAFLDDLLTRAGSTAQHRTVSVVFRTSNVLVTVRYGEQPALVTKVPDSKELQEKARSLARKLAEAISG